MTGQTAVQVAEAASRLAAGDGVLLDVREAWELELATIPGALHIPLDELPARLDEVPREKPVFVLCHHGVRSAFATRMLREAGFDNALNVRGGIDAWERDVDASIGRY